MPEETVPAPFLNIEDINSLPSVENPLEGNILFYDESDVDHPLKTADLQSFRKEIQTGIKGEATPTSSPTTYNPTDYPDGLFEKWEIKTSGTYTNFLDASTPTPQPIQVTSDDLLNNFVQIWVTNGVSKKVLSAKIQGTPNGEVVLGETKGVNGDKVFKAIEPIDETLFDVVGVPASPNLFNPANKYDNILVSTGANVGITGQSAGWNIAVVEVSPTKTYTVSGWNSARNEIAFFSNNLPSPFPTIPPSPYATGLISSGSSATVLGITKSGGKMTFTPPANTKWMVFNIANASEADSVFASFQIEDGTVSTPYQPYNPTSTTTKVLKENFQPKPKIKEIKKAGDLVYIRTVFDSTYDLVRTLNMHGSNSGASILTSTVLVSKSESITGSGIVFHSMNDSVPPPFQVNTKSDGTYSNLGGGHGTPVLDAVSTAHGKTSADLGSTWTDGTGWEFYLVAIIDVNTLRIVGKPKAVSGFDKVKIQPASPLTHVSGATNTGNITFTGTAYEYKPCINTISVKLYIDGKEITADGTYTGDIVKIVDTHNVVDPTQPNLTPPYLPQNNGTMVKNTIEYTFHANANHVITVDNPADWQKNTSLTNQGLIQPQCLTIGTYSALNAYAMNINTTSGNDFKNGVNLAGTISTSIPTTANFTEPTKAIQQMSQVLFTSGNPKVGAGFGYNPLVGMGKQSELLQNSSLFELRGSTKKYYPTGYTRASGTNILRGIGYFAYWDATINPKLSADYYVPFGKSDLYFLNIRSAMTKEKVILAKELQLRPFTVVNSSSTIAIHTLDSSTSEGLIISGIVGDWAVLKFD